MYEYGSVSAHDLDSLVARLNEQGQDDWEAVSVFATAAGYQAVLKRSAAGTAVAAAPALVEEAAAEVPAAEVPAVEVPAVEEPAVEEPVVPAAPVEVEPEGWGAAPEPAVEEPAVEQPAVEEPAVAATTEPAPAPTPEPRPVVTTPAGWYPDPSGRYELRYWNGSEWTEYVARGGQQYTDPPVA